MQEKSSDDLRFELLLKEATEDSLVFLPNTELIDGRIIVKRQIGSGGMGVVYEAADLKLSARVALKVLSEVNPAGIYRLKQEFRALADVSHPYLVGPHELFLDKGKWFFTMDLVEGTNLIEYLGPAAPTAELQHVFLQLASGIEAIHEAGKLHRDLKPNNVLITPKGVVKILDFGLVSDQEVGGVGQTVVEEGISGTPTYMSPEQAATTPAVPASDWYAFGAMLFEALT
jgi:serine/threonine protein kinase